MPRVLVVLLSVPLLLGRVAAQEAYRIAAGDSISVQVLRHADYNTQLVVRPDGRITYPLIGEVEVVGKTVAELTNLITKALSQELRAPQVVINVMPREQPVVYILGDVLRAGPVPFKPGADAITVKDAIAQAGGLPRVLLTAELHRKGEPPVTLDVEHEMVVGAEEATLLHKDDILWVRSVGFVNVIGTAGPAGRVAFEQEDTLLTILAKCGGAPTTADLKHSIILRPDGKQEVVDLEAIQEGRWKGDLPKIEPGDFIILPIKPPQEFVTVLGWVTSPKQLPIDPKVGLKLSEVLAASSPFPEDADAQHARIIHGDGSVTDLDFKALVDGSGDQSLLDMEMKANDVVLVPRQLARVAVMGAVSRPGVYALERGDRLLDVLLRKAGGFQTQRGQKRLAVLVRRPEGPDQQPEVRRLDLTALVTGRAEDQNVELRAEDILFVPEPKVKAPWLEQLSQQLSTPLSILSNLRYLIFGFTQGF